MLKINYEVLVNVKNFKIMAARHLTAFQIRVLVYQQSHDKKRFIPAIPYLILNSEKQARKSNEVTMFGGNKFAAEQKQDKIGQSQKNNVSEIDDQRNAFVTKSFVIRNLEKQNELNQIVVFKNSFEISLDKLALNQKGLTCQQGLMNKIYFCLELHQISSFSSQLIESWTGFSMLDQGSAVAPTNFFSINACANTQFTFLWTSIELLEESNKTTVSKQIIRNNIQKIALLYENLQSNILVVPNQFEKKYSLNSKNWRINKGQNIDQLKDIIKFYNEDVYKLWIRYQQFHIQVIQKQTHEQTALICQKLFQQKLQSYAKCLNQYHWKNHVFVTEDTKQKVLSQSNQQIDINQHSQLLKLQYKESQRHNKNMPGVLAKLKQDKQIDQNLVLYPFEKHSRSIKITNQDFKRVSQICELGRNRKLSGTQNSKIHLIIFVHGYQASSYDMQTLAIYLKYKQPKRIFTYVSSWNEGRTEQKIEESGHRLALQVKNFLNNKFEFEDYEISFVCHSMGGIITRAALKYLQLYKSKFKTFFSLSSPHLGYLYHHSALIKTSLWVLNQVKKDQSMLQLTMSDKDELEKTYLYELSQRKQLQWFKHLIFMGSIQDTYVPFWSALVQNMDFYFQTKQAKIYKTLYKNFTQGIESRIIRLQAVYQDKINDLSSFVGRTAHIRILNCIQIMEMVYLLVEKAF